VTSIHTLIRRHRIVMLVAIASLTPAAGFAAASGTTEPPTDTAMTDTTSGATVAAEPVNLDTNGDGVVQFGVAAAGPRDDGAYYQALVTKVEEFSEANGFEAPIIVDNITAEDAAAELANIAEQGVDVITVGASEIADPLADLVEQYPDIFWYCNCGAGYPENPGLAQSQDDASEINYSAGYATGLLLQQANGDSAYFLGCCDLGFEKESYMAFEMGLQAVDPSFTMTYVPTGSGPFDFDNTSGATEAFNTALSEGADAVYPFLGGAHEPVVQLANEAGVITMSAGSSTACERDDLDFQIEVRFDAGDYLDPILAEIQSGEFQEGDVRVFHVGVDPQPGAEICDPTPEQQTAMDEVYSQIAAGDFAEQFGQIKAEAYAGG
jgi:basic membrane protein A